MCVSDPQEAQSDPARHTRIWERWSGLAQGTCPFGVVLRAGSTPLAADCPFASWVYHPRCLPAGLGIQIAAGTSLEEPELAYLGFQRARARQGEEPTSHAIPARHVTRAQIVLPRLNDLSAAAQALAARALLSFAPGEQHCLVLTLDDGRSDEVADLHPDVPLILRW